MQNSKFSVVARGRVPYLVGVACVATVILPLSIIAIQQASDSGHNSDAPPGVPRSSVEIDSGEFPAVGVVLTAPPVGAEARISADKAVEVVRADGLRSDVQELVEPSVELKLLTNGFVGQVGVDDEDGPSTTDAELIVWDVVFRDAEQRVYGPSDLEKSITPQPCDLHVLVDATTGEVIKGFQAECSYTSE